MHVLVRLHRAIPRLRAWIDDLLATHRHNGIPVSSLGFDRLPTYFPLPILDSAQIVAISPVPVPPVEQFHLREFLPLTTASLAGITYRDVIFVQEGMVTESLCFHELVHVVQWTALGVDAFLLCYGFGFLDHGYAGAPMEAIAYEKQRHFDDWMPMPALVETVVEHANQQRTLAALEYARVGVACGAFYEADSVKSRPSE